MGKHYLNFFKEVNESTLNPIISYILMAFLIFMWLQFDVMETAYHFRLAYFDGLCTEMFNSVYSASILLEEFKATVYAMLMPVVFLFLADIGKDNFK